MSQTKVPVSTWVQLWYKIYYVVDWHTGVYMKLVVVQNVQHMLLVSFSWCSFVLRCTEIVCWCPLDPDLCFVFVFSLVLISQYFKPSIIKTSLFYCEISDPEILLPLTLLSMLDKIVTLLTVLWLHFYRRIFVFPLSFQFVDRFLLDC